MSAVPVVLSPEPFSRETVYAEAPSGSTVRAALVEAVRAGQIDIDDLSRTTLYVDGARIDRAVALDLVLTEGQVVNLVVEPLGGGGSSGGKDIGQLLLTIAVIAVSAWVGGAPAVAAKLGSQMAARIAGAAIMAVGQAAIGAIFAPDNKGMAKANDSYALQSASNQYRPWAPFPMALGEVVAAPDLVAKTFTESRGDEQWIYGILGVHYGPCETSEEKIGDTLISTMGAGDVRIVKHLTPGPRTFSLYPNDVDQLDLSETFDEGVEIIRAASAEGERFDIDIYFPSGLYWRNDKGRFKTEQNDIQASWRPIDEDGAATGAWSAPVTWTFRAASNDPIRRTQRVTLPMGRYEFRLKKLVKPHDPDNVRVDAMYWTAIKSVAFRKPVTDETLSIIEFAVRATALNQGSLAPITCRIKPRVPTWNGSSWTAPVATSNPAALTRWLLTGPAPARPLLTTQADVRLRAWAAICDTYGWTSNIYLTDDRKQDVVLGMLGLAGRASLFWDGTQIAASPWVEKPAPRQLFGGDNLRDHKWSISYAEEVHALRVEFQNIDQGGEADEVYVYADGYGEKAGPGVQAATLVEALRLEGQRTIGRAYRDGRWELGRRIHQRRIDTWSTDIENIASALGDRVRLAYSRVDGGQTMRVRCRRWSGGLVSGLRLAEPVEMEAGKDYAVDLRLASGLYASVPIVTAPGLTREIVFQSARQDTITPAAGDKVAFGVPTRISEDVEIIGIEPGENLTASLVGVRYVAPLLMAGETGPIPPLQTRLTGDRQKDPPAPTLLGYDVSDAGIRVGFAMPPWKGSPITSFSARWRPTPAAGDTVAWSSLSAMGAGAMFLTTPPLQEAPTDDELTKVDIEVWANTASGRVSPPMEVQIDVATVAAPLADDWDVEVRPADANGTQQPGIIVSGVVSADRATSVIVDYSIDDEGPWTQVYAGPWTTKKVSIVGLEPGRVYFVGVTYVSASGVPGDRALFGPLIAPALKAGGFVGMGALASQDLVDWAAQVTGAGKPENFATKTYVYRAQTAPIGAGVNDVWVQVNSSGAALAVYAWNGSAWIKSADPTGLNIAAGIFGQGPGATDPREPDDIAGNRVFAPRVSLTSFNSTTNRRYGLSGATASVPPGENTGKIRLTRTNDGPYLFMNASNFEGLDGAYLNVIRAKVRAVVDEPISDQWRGLVYVYGSFAGSPKMKSVPFPKQKNGSDRMPISGGWPWVEWDFSDDPDFEGATITQIRFYLIPPFTTGSGRMDIDQLLVGSRTSDALGLPGGNVVLRPQDLMNGDALARAGGLLPNWTFEIADSENKPAALIPVYSSDGTRDSIGFRDANRNTLLLGSVLNAGTDNAVGCGFPAIPVNDKMTYRVTIRHRRVQASPAPTSGYYLRMFEAVALDPGTTHVGYPDIAGCTAYSSLKDMISNAAFPGTAWTVQTFDYTPTSGVNFMTVGHLNGQATSADVEIDYVLLTDDMPRVQYMNSAGRIIDGRGMPLNASGGTGLTISPAYPLSKPATNPHTSISVASTLVTMTGAATYSLPSATITGLTADTTYHVFRDLQTSTWVARSKSSSGLAGYFTSADRYLYVGTQITSVDSGGGYSPPPPSPPGFGGGCPAPETPVLLANDSRDGPGQIIAAGEIVAGRDWVWTQHEITLAWGAFPVLDAQRHEARERIAVRMTDGRSQVVAALHRMYSVERAWGYVREVEAGETILGPRPGQLAAIEPASRGPVISFTIGEARTLITDGLLSHNLKPLDP